MFSVVVTGYVYLGISLQPGLKKGEGMKILLGPFARSAVEARLGADVAAGVQAALVHYTRRLRSSQKPIEVPPFLETTPGAELELGVDPGLERALTLEAREQGVSLDQLTAHAVFVYLADLDGT